MKMFRPRCVVLCLVVLTIVSACSQSPSSGDRTKSSTESSWTQKWVSVKYRSDPVDVGAPYFDSLDRSGSSVVRDAWFDQKSQYLVINLNGTNYHYCGLSEDVWLSMQVTASLDASLQIVIEGISLIFGWQIPVSFR